MRSRDEGLGTRLISVWACVGMCGHVIRVGMSFMWTCVGMCRHVWAVSVRVIISILAHKRPLHD